MAMLAGVGCGTKPPAKGVAIGRLDAARTEGTRAVLPMSAAADGLAGLWAARSGESGLRVRPVQGNRDAQVSLSWAGLWAASSFAPVYVPADTSLGQHRNADPPRSNLPASRIQREQQRPDIRALIAQYGDWPVGTMIRIIEGPTPACPHGESGGDPNAVSPDGRNIGLLQVNLVHGWSREQLIDPAFNIWAAHQVYEWQGLAAWSCAAGLR